MNLTAAEYVQEIWNCRRGLVGWRGLMAAVIAQATVDLVVGGAESAVGQEAERFLASAECRWMVEYLGWEYRWPWGPGEAVSDERLAMSSER